MELVSINQTLFSSVNQTLFSSASQKAPVINFSATALTGAHREMLLFPRKEHPILSFLHHIEFDLMEARRF